MASTRDASHLSLPAMRSEERSESAESIYKSERRSSIPVPTGRPNSAPIFPKPTPQPAPVQPSPVQPGLTQPLPRPKSFPSPTHHRFLTPAEWARVAHGVGAIRENETHRVIHPTCWYWPPKGMPEGLYRDVVTQRSKYFFSYHLMSGLRWFLMILQIILGATLTALGSVQLQQGVSITVLAALNTVDAGLLALMHNSGLPDRYRLDKVEYCKVEDFVKELLDTGIVETGQTVDDVLSDCFSRFQDAKATVLANMPDAYTTHTPAKDRPASCPDPVVHFYSHP